MTDEIKLWSFFVNKFFIKLLIKLLMLVSILILDMALNLVSVELFDYQMAGKLRC